jgi:protein-disulfide isomerase
VQAYFRKAVNVAPDVVLELRDVRLAPAPGLLVAVLTITRGNQVQRLPLTLSRDGRFMVQGELTDLAVDPHKMAMQRIHLDGAPVRGAAGAAVTVVVYSDFQCPFCARVAQVFESELLKDYEGRIRLVYKHFPLSIHPWAESAALAAACAGEQGHSAFWLLHDYFFENQAAVTPANVRAKALQVLAGGGFDTTAAAECYDTKRALAAVRSDMEEGAALGVKSTPTFFVNGRRLDGAVPAQTLKRVIDEQLATSS